ncbi:MAG: 3-hydroxyacyl-CoA dehydrogenase NAD-binding domain-containing protein, partial [Pseudomonadota bacterium]
MLSQTLNEKRVAIVGGGVIGGGWAARFLLHGWQVCVFDPHPDTQTRVAEVVDNARRSLPATIDVPLPDSGALVFADTLENAVAGAAWVQESVPERLEMKHKVFLQIQQTAPQAIIGSSTSGFKPSQLQDGAPYPENILVAHPFNPVYLLPLVEVVPTEVNTQQIKERAQRILTGIGMKALLVRREIDAHIADRFLEAVWREALWLVNDDIATTEEIDDAIRFGFGLRWAQMGLFETYRLAGGEEGMAHFIQQFGPALKWPWTKLMDVPDLTDELVQKIADQSDAQSGDYSLRELERIRDRNLVAFLRALK